MGAIAPPIVGSTAGAWKGNPNSDEDATATRSPGVGISDAGGYTNKSGTSLHPTRRLMRGRSCFMYVGSHSGLGTPLGNSVFGALLVAAALFIYLAMPDENLAFFLNLCIAYPWAL